MWDKNDPERKYPLDEAKDKTPDSSGKPLFNSQELQGWFADNRTNRELLLNPKYPTDIKLAPDTLGFRYLEGFENAQNRIDSIFLDTGWLPNEQISWKIDELKWKIRMLKDSLDTELTQVDARSITPEAYWEKMSQIGEKYILQMQALAKEANGAKYGPAGKKDQEDKLALAILKSFQEPFETLRRINLIALENQKAIKRWVIAKRNENGEWGPPGWRPIPSKDILALAK